MSKIVQLTTVHGRYDVRIFLKQCCTLANYGYDVTLVVQDGKGNETIEGVKIIDLGEPYTSRVKRIIFSPRNVLRFLHSPPSDIIHFHDPELIPVGLKLKKSGKKVIYDVHEDYGEDISNKEWLPKVFRNIVAKVFDRYEKKAAKVFDGIVTATPHIRTKFEKLNGNSIDINNYPILSGQAINNSTGVLKSKSVNFVGAINRIRGILEMVQALESTDVNLVLAGKFTTPEDFDLAKSMKGWSKVDYRGQVDRSEVAKIFAGSAAGMVLYHPGPNHDNSQPNKLFEYMAAGLPVIASNFPLWRKIIEGNKCGVCVNPLNPDEIANAIKWMLRNPIEAKTMGQNGRDAVLRKYNWEAESHKLISFYEKLLK